MAKKIGFFLLGILAVVIGVLLWNSPGQTSPILTANGKQEPGSIARLEAIRINGSTQWLLIRGGG